MRPMTIGVLLLTALVLSACESASRGEKPPPRELTGDETGYFCDMLVRSHHGPKGQIFIASRAEPLWFTSVRDTLAFTRLPDEPRTIHAIYVTDVGRASWDRPEPGAWVDAEDAWNVVGSNGTGGMGAAEVVPFKDRAQAREFATRHGGVVTDLESVPTDQLLGTVGPPPEPAPPSSSTKDAR